MLIKRLALVYDDQGAFAFDGVPPGVGYDVTASGPDFAISHALGIDVEAATHEVEHRVLCTADPHLVRHALVLFTRLPFTRRRARPRPPVRPGRPVS